MKLAQQQKRSSLDKLIVLITKKPSDYFEGFFVLTTNYLLNHFDF